MFQPIIPQGYQHVSAPFLAFVYHFKVVSQKDRNGQIGPYPNGNFGMYVLEYARRANGCRMGCVINMKHIQTDFEVTPYFMGPIEDGISYTNSMVVHSKFILNKYSNKELFYLHNKPSN